MLQQSGTEQVETTALPELSAETEIQEEMPTALQDEELAELTASIEAARLRGKSRGQAWRRSQFVVSAVLMAISLSIFFVLARGIVPPIWLSILIMAGSVLAVPVGIISGFLWSRRSKAAERAAANRLATIDDVGAATPILDALRFVDDKALRPELWQALGRLLPRMTEAEALALGPERLSALAVWLDAWDHPLTRRAYVRYGSQPLPGMLHVLGLIGQERYSLGNPIHFSLTPTLERWAKGEGAGKDQAVRQAAEACREAIRQKTVQAHSSKHLLRASSAAPSSPEALLRPSQNSQETDPQELLRPNSGE